MPDWSEIHLELRKKGVTLELLWEEYKSVYPEGYQYSRFCELYRDWRGLLKLWMRQDHRAGEKLFVDYAGQTVGVVNPKTGEIKDAQIFVVVLGASSYTFCEATLVPPANGQNKYNHDILYLLPLFSRAVAEAAKSKSSARFSEKLFSAMRAALTSWAWEAHLPRTIFLTCIEEPAVVSSMAWSLMGFHLRNRVRTF